MINTELLPRYYSRKQIEGYVTGFGHGALDRLVKESKCRIKVGSRYLYDKQKLDQYLESIAGRE